MASVFSVDSMGNVSWKCLHTPICATQPQIFIKYMTIFFSSFFSSLSHLCTCCLVQDSYKYSHWHTLQYTTYRKGKSNRWAHGALKEWDIWTNCVITEALRSVCFYIHNGSNLSWFVHNVPCVVTNLKNEWLTLLFWFISFIHLVSNSSDS